MLFDRALALLHLVNGDGESGLTDELSGAASSMQLFWPILRSEPNLNFALSSGAAPASCKAAFYELYEDLVNRHSRAVHTGEAFSHSVAGSLSQTAYRS